MRGGVVAVQRADLVLDLQEARGLARADGAAQLLVGALAQLVLIGIRGEQLVHEPVRVRIGHRGFLVHVVEHGAVLPLGDPLEVAHVRVVHGPELVRLGRRQLHVPLDQAAAVGLGGLAHRIDGSGAASVGRLREHWGCGEAGEQQCGEQDFHWAFLQVASGL